MRKAALVVALGAVLVIVIGGVGTAVCHYSSLDCHLRGGGPPPLTAGVHGGTLSLPSGFRSQAVASNLDAPTDFAFLPDGRILVAEKGGLIRLVRDGAPLPTPFLDLRDRVNTYAYRGILAVAADPHFAENGFVYVLYVRDDDSGPSDGPRTMRLSRFTASGDKGLPASEHVLIGSTGRGSCGEQPATSDCLPSDIDHDGGGIVFASDGTMFVSTGDGGGGPEEVEKSALRAQDIDALGGKVLHITRLGLGLPTNPFWNGDATANRSKVWAYGMRNPFRIALRPGSELPFVGDVGKDTTEEVDSVPAGANLGWPCYEGAARSPGYEDTELCRQLFERGTSAVWQPFLTFPNPGSSSVTGGSFYAGTSYPDEYRGAYFYADFVSGWMKDVRIDESGSSSGAPVDFASNANGPVAIKPGPAGDLFYLALTAGTLLRIVYDGS